MGTYITHEGLPFHGALEKIRIRSCRVADLSLPGFDEKQLLEITRDGTAKLTQKTPEGTKKAKTRISQADTDYIFAAFSETFANYRRKRIPSVSGHWRVRLLTDDDEVYFYHGANGKEYFPDIFHASSSVIADIFEACGIDLPDYVRILYYNDYMGDESIGRAAIEKIELAWQADPSKFRVDKKQNRLIYSYPPDGPWYELKYIADELPNSLEAEISGGNQLIMNYEQAQELFGIKFRRWLGIFNL